MTTYQIIDLAIQSGQYRLTELAHSYIKIQENGQRAGIKLPRIGDTEEYEVPPAIKQRLLQAAGRRLASDATLADPAGLMQAFGSWLGTRTDAENDQANIHVLLGIFAADHPEAIR